MSGLILRGTPEVEQHLKSMNATAACIGDVLLFNENVSVSDVLEETYHFKQNLLKMNHDKPETERFYLNEIDAQQYLLSLVEKYHIPEQQVEVTKENLRKYREGLRKYYDSIK